MKQYPAELPAISLLESVAIASDLIPIPSESSKKSLTELVDKSHILILPL
jgi:hypothetical protein